MPLIYELTYLPSGRIAEFHGRREDYYRLPDGKRLELHTVWCRRCGTVTHGEEIETVEEIDRKMADLDRLAAEIRAEMTRPPAPDPGAPGDRFQRQDIAALRRRRRWRLLRTSPPRCTECGTTEIDKPGAARAAADSRNRDGRVDEPPRPLQRGRVRAPVLLGGRGTGCSEASVTGPRCKSFVFAGNLLSARPTDGRAVG